MRIRSGGGYYTTVALEQQWNFVGQPKAVTTESKIVQHPWGDSWLDLCRSASASFVHVFSSVHGIVSRIAP